MRLLRFFKNFLSAYIGIVFLLILIFTTFVGYQFRRNYACDYIWILVAVAVLIFLIYLFLNKAKTSWPKFWSFIHSNKCFYLVLIVGSVLLLLGQIYIASGGWFIVGWDTRDVIFPDKQMNADYMSMYPNQLFLAGLFRRINAFVCGVLGFDFYQYYFLLVILSVLCVFASVIFTGLIAKKITSPFVATITFLCAMLCVGFSPWIMVPYSDTFAMLFTTMTLFWYCYIKINPLKWFLIPLTSIVGYSIKPTAIFVLLAILFVELCLLITNRNEIIKKYSKVNLVKAMICILVALLGFGFASVASGKISNYGVQIDKDRSFTATHFLMMGINLENHGGWNNDDVMISRSYPNVAEREAGNLREWQHRLFTYGIPDISFILLNKTLTNFNDGSFAWEAEVPWMMENRGDNPIVWAFYGIDPADAHNDNNNFSAYPRQALWYMILIGCIFTFLNKKPKREEFVAYLSILAISAFLTVCEPDPRYLLLYVPYFVLIAPKGWAMAYKKFILGEKIDDDSSEIVTSKTNKKPNKKVSEYGTY